MTYRRLFLRLFIGSTLLLAVLWVVSIKGYARFVFAPKSVDPYLWGSLHSATVNFQILTHIPPTPFKETSSFEYTTDPEMLAILGSGKRTFGKFQMAHVLKQPPSGPGIRFRTVGFPIWFPWLLTTAGGYLLMRRMEKRSRSGKEKELAAEQTSTGT